MNGPYKIGTLGRLTGVSPALLRTWQRRFSLIVRERGEGGLRIVAWHLARHRVRVASLGSSMSLEDLALAGRTSRAHAVPLSVTRRAVFTRHMTAITRLFPETVVEHLFVGGRGVPSGARSTAHRIALPHDTPLETVVQRIVSDVGSVKPRPRTRRPIAR